MKNKLPNITQLEKKGYLNLKKWRCHFSRLKIWQYFFACVRSFQTCLQVNFCASSSVCLPFGCILHINVFAGSITLFLQISLDLTFIFVTQFSLVSYFTPGSVMWNFKVQLNLITFLRQIKFSGSIWVSFSDIFRLFGCHTLKYTFNPVTSN